MMVPYIMEESSEQVYAKHKYLIRSLINAIVVNNPSVVGTEDLHQVGAMALVDALGTYDASLGSFSSYIRKCIWHALLKEANTFNGPFTTDEKVRRRANLMVSLQKQGVDDHSIMAQLGIKNKTTLLALKQLASCSVIDIDEIDIEAEESFDQEYILKILDEIGLDKVELQFAQLTIKNNSIDDLVVAMSLSRSRLYAIKASIREKILVWGQG